MRRAVAIITGGASFHELRMLMSTVTLLMSSFDLPRFAEVLHAERASTLEAADAELSTASDRLSQAASQLTTARQRLEGLV